MNFICPKCSTPLSFEPEKKLSVCPSCDPVVFESGAYSLMSSEEHRESQIFDFQDDLDEGFDDEI